MTARASPSSRGFIASLACAALLAASSQASADVPRHTALYYTATAKGDSPASVEQIRQFIAYVSADGRAIDWMFDGVLIFSFPLALGPDKGTTTDSKAFDAYRTALFAGGQLQRFADSVRALRVELGTPAGFRLKVWLCAPWTAATDASGNVTTLINDFAASKVDDALELVGFYWPYETLYTSTIAAAKSTSAFVHAQKLKMLWIPYSGSTVVKQTDAGAQNVSSEQFASVGFDVVTIQPNFAFSNVSTQQFETIADEVLKVPFTGTEFEFGPTRNQVLGEVPSALAYFDAANRYNWTENAASTYYRSEFVTTYAADPATRVVYDRLYRSISAHPGDAAKPKLVLQATDDTYTEHAPARTTVTHGSDGSLAFGTNSLPNDFSTFLKFDVPPLQPRQRLLAAYLTVYAKPFAGASLMDVGTLSTTATGWSEGKLNGANEPAVLSPLGTYRFAPPPFPSRRSMDVTNAVSGVLGKGGGPISFRLAKAVEPQTEPPHEAAIYSKEVGTATAPVLVLTIDEVPELDAGVHDASVSPDAALADADSDGVAPSGASSGCDCEVAASREPRARSAASLAAASALLLGLVFRRARLRDPERQ